ncbi:hypothetical protein ACO34A_24625 (plasmid) [Rhizobium sp. ACO-34A]|nr:alpha/beta hydrolase [Rhizobium sp. ACO-34A]ATN36961.1 hypothetical protein ACO34A_24625 [Rhizobium sp. ACO-34A]
MSKPEILTVPDVIYSTREGRALLADIYVPQDGVRQKPAIIWVHGGGWRFGDRKLSPHLARYYAERGFVMVSVDYRLSKQAVFPAALEDIKTAVRWLKSVAERYAVDPARIGLWGGSAGGHLAALCATSGPGSFEGPAEDGVRGFDSCVAAVVDCYGPTDFLQIDAHRDPEGKPSEDVESIQLPKGVLSAQADSLESAFVGAPIETVPEIVQAANPIAHIRRESVLPPFLIVHGRCDTAVPVHQSVILFEALKNVGNDATLLLVEGLGHSFTNRKSLDQRSFAYEQRDQSGTRRLQGQIFETIGNWFIDKLIMIEESE